MRVEIRKVGDSSGVILPKTLLAELGVVSGDVLDIAVVGGRIVLSPLGQEARAACARAATGARQSADGALAWPEPSSNEDERPDDRGLRRP
ncbi:MAG TPA: AbrB/MazE/SpoVT family DNA-binding domain-containing protein [Caulobacteraceae bacterium]